MFISIIAALLASAILVPFTIGFISNLDQFLSELITVQLRSIGAPEAAIAEAIARVKNITNMILPLIPVSDVLQSVIIGSLLGLLYGYLIASRGLRPAYAALTTGAAYICILNALPLAVMYFTYEDIVAVILKYIPAYVIFGSGVAYTLLLTLFSIIKGPWTRWAEAEPSKY